MDKTLIKDAVIDPLFYGQRIDSVLAQLFPEFSRSQLTHWLKAGAILINDRPYKPKEKVYGGEQIKLTVALSALQPDIQAEAIPLTIVYEDQDVLIVNKPAGLVVHPGAGNFQHTLVNALLFHDPNLEHLPRAGIIHRLDKDTTGLLIVAKTLSAHTQLIRQMQAREIERHYLALVYGRVIGGGTIETAFGRHPRHRTKMAVCNQGKPAITHYALKKQFQQFTLLNVKLQTGRTHQIRVHMAHIHHPIVGDPLYGGKARLPSGITDEVRLALVKFKRQALHACTLSFFHPQSGKKLTFEAPLPDDFHLLLTILDKNFV